MVGENRDIRTGNRKMRLKQVWRPRHTYIYITLITHKSYHTMDRGIYK